MAIAFLSSQSRQHAQLEQCEGVTAVHRVSLTTIISSAAIGFAALAAAPAVQAQARFATGPATSHLDAPALLSALANYRAVRWASAAPAIHCAPAPLTERPGVQSDLARPRVVPIEESFADAQSVKRAIAYRMRAVALERR
jgi:hypothetical protein